MARAKFEVDEPPVQVLNFPTNANENPGIDQLAQLKDQRRLHEHSPLPSSRASDSSRQLPQNRGRAQLSAEMIREGNRIIE